MSKLENADRWLIAGTDTDAGKTVASGLLTAALRNISDNIGYFKPVQTGGEPEDDGLTAPDVDTVCDIVRQTIGKEISAQAGYVFQKPCSPHLAAEIEGREISITKLVENANSFASQNKFTIAEGAGGVYVPLNDTQTTLDFMQALNWPVILVCPNRLGTINHTLLTLEILAQRKIPVEGVVVTHLTPQMDADIQQDNIKAIRKFSGVKILAELPHMAGQADYKTGMAAWQSWLKQKGVAACR